MLRVVRASSQIQQRAPSGGGTEGLAAPRLVCRKGQRPVGTILKGLGIDGTFLAEIVNFILLLLLLSWRAFPATKRVLAERRQRVEGALAQAEGEREEAIRIKEQHLNELQAARAEAQAILDRAQRAAGEQTRQILDEARAHADRLRRQAEEEIARERDAAILALRREVADLVVAATERLLRQRVDAAADRRLVEEFLADVSER
jgi:F-type H+-transporting ATPase subunit b